MEILNDIACIPKLNWNFIQLNLIQIQFHLSRFNWIQIPLTRIEFQLKKNRMQLGQKILKVSCYFHHS